MNDYANGTAPVAVIETEVTDIQVVNPKIGMSLRQEMSPSGLREEIARQQEMRAILTEYVRGSMIKDHHYYSFKEGDKPALTQDGAYLICGLFKAIPGPVETKITHDADGHFTVIATATIYNADGLQIATGDGCCTTREKKYAGRWAWDNDVPDDIDVAKLKSKSGTGKNNKQWTKYLLPNDELGDLENTVLKMASKRATVAAVKKLPLVSELFANDPNSGGNDRNQPAKAQSAKPVKQQAPASPQYVAKAVELSDKLQKVHGLDTEDLAIQFLPEGVAAFKDLTEEQATEIVPALVELINSRIGGKA